MHNIIIDPEFKSLIPTLTKDERSGLEVSLQAEGCRDALVVWEDKNILVDGHNRHELCTKHGIEYSVIYKAFESREDVVVWICDNQMSRRNISQYARDVLVLQRKDAMAAKAKKNMSMGGSQGLSESDKPLSTRDELAKLSGTSNGGIAQSEYIQKAAPEPIKRKATNGDISRNAAYDIAKILENATDDFRKVVLQLDLESPSEVETLYDWYKIRTDDDHDKYSMVSSSGFMQLDGNDYEPVLYKGSTNKQRAEYAKQHAEYRKRLAMEAQQQDRADKARDVKVSAGDDKDECYVNGNCLELLPKLAVGSIRLLLTDPPYGQAFQSNRRTATAQADMIQSDADLKQALDLLAKMLQAVDMSMADDCHLLVFTSEMHEAEFKAVIRKANYDVRRSLVWIKNNHGSGDLNDFAPQYEHIIHARRGRLPVSPRIPDVLYAPTFNTSAATPDAWKTNRTHHPTEKPVGLLERLITSCTLPDELVVDPFAGTGATVEAALNLGRKAYGIELVEDYHNEGTVRIHGQLRAA